MLDNQSNPRRTLVTGGASGFGLATAQALLELGHQVAIGDVDSQQLKCAFQTLKHPNLLPIELDVTCGTSARDAVETCRTRFGGLDTLVNSAGVIHMTALEEITEEEWDHVIDVDLKGTFLCSQAAAPLLRRSGRGRIVNLGSDAGRIGCPQIVPYCAAKFGVVGLTKSLAAELATDGVTVNCVSPVGVSATGMGQFVLQKKIELSGLVPEDILAATAAEIPLQRNPTTADIVNAILFFLAEESAFLTGVVLDVDGGMLSILPVRGT
jgi:NAD(P)-dependent dehydrogenase (short-subunit alcohol dehydrogenase family)